MKGNSPSKLILPFCIKGSALKGKFLLPFSANSFNVVGKNKYGTAKCPPKPKLLYCIYPKYWDTLSTYHTSPEV